MGGAINRPAPAGSGEESPSPSWGGAHFPPSPNFPTKSRPRTSRGNGNPPATETGRT